MLVILEKSSSFARKQVFSLKKRKILELGITTEIGFTILFKKFTHVFLCFYCKNQKVITSKYKTHTYISMVIIIKKSQIFSAVHWK